MVRTRLTTREAAAHCRVSVPTLKRWIRQGKLAAFRTPGGHHRIDLAAFQRFCADHGIPAFPARPSELRVLLVDDDPGMLGVLTDVLAAHWPGARVETAGDGYEALIKVGLVRPSVLILDVVMPRLDGVEVCRRLKAVPQTRGIRILGLTGHPELVPALIAAGADVALTKPVAVEDVRRQLERLIGSVEVPGDV